MKKKFLAVLTLFLLTVPVLALAGEPAVAVTLDEVVVTATRSAEDVKKIPAKVEVIDRQAVELTTGDNGSRSTADGEQNVAVHECA